MAQYQPPPDPRFSSSSGRTPRTREPIPWLWLLGGIVVAAVAIWGAIEMAGNMLLREPLAVQGSLQGTPPSEPIVIRLTAPATLEPSPTPVLPTPTPIPTLTPLPTPDRSEVPTEITVDFYAEVINTDGIGVSVRGGPSTANVRVEIAAEGSVLLVVGGPVEGDGFTWWQVQLGDATQGWVAGNFLRPAPVP
jgi:hypothetical protein